MNDAAQLREWIRRDPYHFYWSTPDMWLTGNGLLAFRLEDDAGPLTYVRLDEEGEYVRLSTQFAPRDVVSKKRLMPGIVECLKRLTGFYTGRYKGFVFYSLNPSLVAFMAKQGFNPIGDDNYRLDFEGTNVRTE